MAAILDPIRSARSFEDAVFDLMREEFDRQVNDCIERACEDLRKRLREKTAGLAASIASNYDISRHGMDVVIRVRNG